MKLLLLFCYGGCLYTVVEILFKGDSHWTMFILGGICFLLVGGINEVFDHMPLILQMCISAVIITLLEFVCGCIVNLGLGMNVWNYEKLPLNIMGQICPVFTIAWFFLSLVGIFADDFLRYKMFGEQIPQYRIL